nr:hypothetical protein [Tanacetum cinerariifolium]
MHNNIMAAGSRDHPPMLATGRYPQWFVTIFKQQHKLDEVSYHKLFDILKQYQKEVNELCAERSARNANPLALVATAQANQDPYYQTSKSQKSYAPSSKPSIPSRSHATTRYKGKEIAKPITPPSKSASEEDSDPEQAQRDKDKQNNLALIGKKPKRVKTPRIIMKRCCCANKLRKEVPTADTCTDSEPLKQEQNDTGYNVFANDLQHFDQSESISNTCIVEKDDSNVIPDSSDMCDDVIQNDQNDIESDDERVALTNLIANLKLDEIVDNAWVKHRKDQFCALTAKDMEILIQTCLMPLALKTQNDSFIFVHELKQEMHANLKYVESLEKEIDELESDKAEFSNMYDMILQECVSNEVMCSYLLLFSDLDALAELQCLYLHKVKECDCLAQKLSKQTEFVSKEVHTELLQRFAKAEKHLISFEIALQKCKEQDEIPEVLKEFLTMIQRNIEALVITVRTDRGTEFLNKTLNVFLFKEEEIEHQTSTTRTPKQNGVVKGHLCTLVEAARTMLSALKLPLFFWLKQLRPHAILKTDPSSSRLMRKWHITSSMTGNLQSNTFTILVAFVI